MLPVSGAEQLNSSGAQVDLPITWKEQIGYEVSQQVLRSEKLLFGQPDESVWKCGAEAIVRIAMCGHLCSASCF
jgi:hypothetical protein